MAEMMLLFQRTTREGNWILHLSTVSIMMPWYFAYDRVNCARYLPVYWTETQKYGFNLTAFDHVIEQTFNRESKSKGGLTGITLKRGAAHRWVLSEHERSSTSNQCEIMAGKEFLSRNRKELDQSRIKCDAMHTKNVRDSLLSFINSFNNKNEQLLNIVTGGIISDSLKNDIENAYAYGNKEFSTFINDRLVEKKIDLFHPIKYFKLKTFSDTGKNVQTSVKSENIALKTSRQLLSRLLLVAKVKNLNLEDLMAFSLNPIPAALGNYGGSLVKTNKAKLMHFNLGHQNIHLSITNISPNSTLIIDGMAMLHQLKCVPSTFGELARTLLKQLVNIATELNCTRVDFVTDSYPDISIKQGERSRRSAVGVQLFKITSENQPIPKQWKKFLALSVNKEAIITFLHQIWTSLPAELYKNIIFFITHQTKCYSINNDAGNLNICDITYLHCDHEEADSRMLLHASKTYKNVIIKSCDADILVIALSLGIKTDSNLYILNDSQHNRNLISIADIYENLDKSVCEAMIGESWIVNTDLKLTSEKFVCDLYGYKGCSSINLCRYNWLRLGILSDTNLPPNQDSLQKHILRANYQAGINRRSLSNFINAPCPSQHGWKISEGILEVDWISEDPVPPALIGNVHCKCKNNRCSTGSCSCHSSKLHCSELCLCTECANLPDNAD
ncbi:hypothetical protein AVEN_68937-1 [Araneus ventricosus]|uniref:CRC domain-containing protein n=1 Tax=Araneus ventricosus TaxID=182803 RepID=A0A4Y2HI57_ARAVE|nr:hypothetical protein AVEN_68937-1 [Araneus ventricosus]